MMKRILSLAVLCSVAAVPALAYEKERMHDRDSSQYFNNMDTNRDNVLSSDEYTAYQYGYSSFEIADINNDNVVTPQEFAEYRYKWPHENTMSGKEQAFVPGNEKAARFPN